jgi:hypothetical protein
MMSSTGGGLGSSRARALDPPRAGFKSQLQCSSALSHGGAGPSQGCNLRLPHPVTTRTTTSLWTASEQEWRWLGTRLTQTQLEKWQGSFPGHGPPMPPPGRCQDKGSHSAGLSHMTTQQRCQASAR